MKPLLTAIALMIIVAKCDGQAGAAAAAAAANAAMTSTILMWQAQQNQNAYQQPAYHPPHTIQPAQPPQKKKIKKSISRNYYDSVYRVIIPKGKYEYIEFRKWGVLIKVTKNTQINYAEIVDLDANDTITIIDTVGKLTVYPK